MEPHGGSRRFFHPLALNAVIELLRTLSTRRFCAALLAHVNAAVRVDHCSLLRLTPGPAVQLFGAEGVASFVARGARAVASYVRRYHRIDPIRRLLQSLEARSAVVMRRERRADVCDASYRRACYDEPGVVDRICVVTADTDGALVALVLQRQASSGEFSDDDCRTLAALASLLATACCRHIELLVHAGADAAAWRSRLASLCPDMSGRELDVAAGQLAGLTMRETANALGIAHSSVVTYAERAYSRLGVASLRELRARFAAAGSAASAPTPRRRPAPIAAPTASAATATVQ